MKTERVAQTLGTAALLVGGYVWWRGRRIGLALMGGGILVLALSRMFKHKKTEREIQTIVEEKSLLEQLLDETNPRKINALKATVYRRASVADVEKLLEKGFFENAKAKLNAASEMPEDAKRHLLVSALKESSNNITEVLAIELYVDDKSQELRDALANYAKRVKCTVKQRIELAERMLSWKCSDEQVAEVLKSHLVDLLSLNPRLAARLFLTNETVGEAIAKLDDPFPALFAFLKTNRFDELVQKIQVTPEKYEAAVNGRVDGALSSKATDETRQLHKKWYDQFLALAPEGFDKWPTKTELLKKDDDLKHHMTPLIYSLKNEVWADSELQKIASKVPALVFVQMTEEQKKFVRPTLDAHVKTEIGKLDK